MSRKKESFFTDKIRVFDFTFERQKEHGTILKNYKGAEQVKEVIKYVGKSEIFSGSYCKYAAFFVITETTTHACIAEKDTKELFEFWIYEIQKPSEFYDVFRQCLIKAVTG